MPRRYLQADEWYPVLSLREQWYDWDGDESAFAEFTEAELVELRRVGAEFAAWQTKLLERFNASSYGDPQYGSCLDEAKDKAESVKQPGDDDHVV